jgi:hypothetical protein
MKPEFPTLCSLPLKRWKSWALLLLSAAQTAFVIPAHSLELDEFPALVQDTVNTLSQGGTVSGAVAADALGEPLFSININRDGTDRRWTLDTNGVPISASVRLQETPEAVQKTIQQLGAKAGTVTEILRSYENGKVVYEPNFHSESFDRTYTMDAAGTVTNWQIPLSEVPQRILKRSAAIFKGSPLKQCFYSEEDKEPLFTLSASQASGPHWVTFDSKGDISEEEQIIPWEAAPEPLQNAVIQKVGTKNHVRILRLKEEESLHYEVWTFTGAKLVIFWVLSDGSVSTTAPQ